jgi:protein tyrosine/serine phosphatase
MSPAASTMPKKLYLATAMTCLTLAAATGGYLGYLQWSGNFHTVIAGKFYRSAQPSAQQIASYVRANGIRTIINLRGADEGKSWYRDEIETSKALGVNHVDFKMASSKILTPDRAEELLDILRTAQKPIWIHCQSGADRTGLISVMYSNQVAGVAEETAEEQLSIWYGHVGIPFLSKTYAMDESWHMLEKKLNIEAKVTADTQRL